MVKGHYVCECHTWVMQRNVILEVNNLKMKTESADKSFSIFTYICVKFHDSIPLLGKYCLFQKSRDVIIRSCPKELATKGCMHAERIIDNQSDMIWNLAILKRKAEQELKRESSIALLFLGVNTLIEDNIIMIVASW